MIRDSLTILGNRSVRDAKVEGYRNDGPVAVVRFELDEEYEAGQPEARILRRREVNGVIEQLLVRIYSGTVWR